MNILFDLNHPVDVNFFKNAILNLKNDGQNVNIIFRRRGKLEIILRYELGMIPITMIGEHKKGLLKKVISQLLRDYLIIPFIRKNQIDLVVCFGATSAISAKYCRVPYLAFDDDFEYKIPFYHANWFSTRHIFPDFIDFSNGKTTKYHGFKELAYLHPKYLKVSKEILLKYSIIPNEYVFIREIASNESLNYQDNVSMLSKIINKVKEKGLTIILSLEDKDMYKNYSKDCIILEEPVSDIYSLMYYSLFAVSSGDTVARETALLGVPTIYTGGRQMAVNDVLIKVGAMYDSTDYAYIHNFIDELTIEKKNEVKKMITYYIEKEWEDTTSIILDQINAFQ